MKSGYDPTTAALAAAEAAQRAMQKEEEIGDEALSGDWEFKIVRASMGKFRKREEFENLLTEEAEFGWVLLEKLDDSRVRFKRHIKERSRDRMAGIRARPVPLHLWLGSVQTRCEDCPRCYYPSDIAHGHWFLFPISLRITNPKVEIYDR